MKLKTLKDINWTQKDMNNIIIAADIKDLRQEAIKWINELEKTIIYPYGDNIPIFDTINKNSEYVDSVSFIKHFFNITNKELSD